jgi:hypothetical protein
LKSEVSKETIKTIKEKIQIRTVRGRRNKCERLKKKKGKPLGAYF